MEQVDEALQTNPALAHIAPSTEDFIQRVKSADWYQELKNSKPLRAQFRSVDRELSLLGEDAAARSNALEMGVGNDVNRPESFLDLNKWQRDLREKFQPPPATGGGIPPQPPKSAKYLEKLERTMADYIDEKATAALGALGEDSSAYTELTRQYSSFSKLGAMAQKTINRGNRIASPTDHALGITGFLASVVSGHPLAGTLYGGAAAFANNLMRTRGNSVIAGLARDASEMNGTIERAAHQLAGRTAEGATVASSIGGRRGEARAPSSLPALQREYQQTVGRVRELAEAATGGPHVANLAKGVAAQYPDVGVAASRKLLDLYQYLHANIPKPTQASSATLTPLASKERVAPSVMQTYLSRVRGVTQPRAVIEDLGNGILDREALNAFKETYPRAFDQLRETATKIVASSEKPLTTQQTVFLSMTFGFVGNQSLEPQKLEQIQQTFVAMQQSGQTQQSDRPKAPQHQLDAQAISGAMALPNSQKGDS
jgi:hypothetical protein